MQNGRKENFDGGQDKRKRDAEARSIIKKVAEVHKVTERHVEYVINGERNNEDIMTTYMFLQEGENKLLQAAKSLVPFD